MKGQGHVYAAEKKPLIGREVSALVRAIIAALQKSRE